MNDNDAPEGDLYTFTPTFTFTPVVLDPESFDPRQGFITRYGRRLLEEGGRYYTIGDFRFRYMKKPSEKVNWLKEGF